MINCKNITKTYGKGDTEVTVLNDVSFSIKAGEFVAIIGPSGSGKSTLMNILGALDSPSSGHYELNGQDVSSLSDDELAKIRGEKIGFVFQSFNLLPRATVIRNVQLPLIYERIPFEERIVRATKALRDAGMEDSRFNNKSNQISGGQMQRVAIARAIVNNPVLILADEPTGNLDQKTGAVVMNTFRKLHADGRTIILITHDMHVAENANRIIQIQDGKIIEDRKNITSSRMSDRKVIG